MWIKTPNGNLFNAENGVSICLTYSYNPKLKTLLDVNDVTVEEFATEKAAADYIKKLAEKLEAVKI